MGYVEGERQRKGTVPSGRFVGRERNESWYGICQSVVFSVMCAGVRREPRGGNEGMALEAMVICAEDILTSAMREMKNTQVQANVNPRF